MRALNRCLVVLAVIAAATPLCASNCSWNTTPSTVAFGTYTPFSSSALATTTQFSFRCTPNSYSRLILSTGGAGVYVPTRLMTGPNSAQYNIYLDAGGSQIWGDRTAGTVTYDQYNSTPSNKDFTDFMYGIAPSGQDLAVGSYSDTVYATLQYSNNPTGPWTSLPNVTIAVSMNVVAVCRVDAFSMDFGTYNPFTATALNQSTLLKVYCTRGGAPTSITLNNGSFALGTQNRMMSAAGQFMNYSATLGSIAGTSTSANVPINGGFTISGSIPAGQDVSTGSYTDTLVATVNY